MKVFIHILLVFLTSLLMSCASDTKKSILEERAGYSNSNMPPLNVNGASGAVHYVPTRIPEKVMIAWLHAKELPSKDYFWGSWISVIVAPEGWEMTKVEIPKNDKRKSSRTEDRPLLKPQSNDGSSKSIQTHQPKIIIPNEGNKKGP